MAGLYLDNLPLLLDHKQQATALLDKYLPLDRVEPGGYLSRAIQSEDFPLPNYRRDYPLTIGVNQFYFPSGSVRWGYGFALCGKPVKDYLDTQGYDGTFDIKFATPRHTITTPMLVLDPIPVTGDGSDGTTPRLWILPLVDTRYRWQFQPVDNQFSSQTTWDGLLLLISNALTALGDTLSYSTPDPDYMVPTPDLFAVRWPNVGTLLEAVAASVGQRVVRNWNGTYQLQTAGDAALTLSNNIALTPENLYLGGDIDDISLPSSVRMTFRKAINTAPADDWWDEWSHTESVTCPGQINSNYELTVRSLAWAVYDDEQAISPRNATELQAVCKQYAADYSSWMCDKIYDRSYTGLQDWEMTGIDDCIVINFGHECDPELTIKDRGEAWAPKLNPKHDRLVTVRAISNPSNFASVIQGTGSNTEEVNEGGRYGDKLFLMRVGTQQTPWQHMLPGQSVGCEEMVWQDTTPCGYILDPTRTARTMYDPQRRNCLLAEEWAWTVYKLYSCEGVPVPRFEVIGEQGLRRRAIAENDVLCGASGSFRLIHPNQGAQSLIIVQALVDWGFRKNIEGQDEVWLQWDGLDQNWYVEEMAEPLFARATLDNNTCPTDQLPAVSNFMYADRKDYDCNFLPGNPDNPPGNVSNVPGLGGMASDSILLRRDMTGKRDEQTGWEIVQITEHQVEPYTTIEQASCSIDGTKEPITTHKCKPGGQPGSIASGTAVNVITGAGLDSSGGNCRLQMTQTQICVLDVGSSQLIYPVVFSPAGVVEDVFDDTTALKQLKKSVFVPCVDAATEHTIVDYFDCPPIQQPYQPQTT